MQYLVGRIWILLHRGRVRFRLKKIVEAYFLQAFVFVYVSGSTPPLLLLLEGGIGVWFAHQRGLFAFHWFLRNQWNLHANTLASEERRIKQTFRDTQYWYRFTVFKVWVYTWEKSLRRCEQARGFVFVVTRQYARGAGYVATHRRTRVYWPRAFRSRHERQMHNCAPLELCGCGQLVLMTN